MHQSPLKFSDVTLISYDQHQITAHKLVLSASSEYFKNIFKNNKVANPFICLEGVSSTDLNNILDYIYNGEVQIYEEHINRFLSVAQRFKIEGLLGEKKEEEKEEEEEEIVPDFEPHSKPNSGSSSKSRVKRLEKVKSDPDTAIQLNNLIDNLTKNCMKTWRGILMPLTHANSAAKLQGTKHT